ncbi:hypothetical protein C1929_17985 [Stenotrophomonas sp. ZAC14D1_NAIMI4_6]|nr:hypothetical protein C1929_17985 [Stenotrophomonas sp. ZAC14D1_NAIMI4_6]AWH42658.1 hypothetical protein C1927_17985 [Stenotrophomonas sp. ZAC14D1_NAIMI4_1]
MPLTPPQPDPPRLRQFPAGCWNLLLLVDAVGGCCWWMLLVDAVGGCCWWMLLVGADRWSARGWIW